jgi:hypothetical protein
VAKLAARNGAVHAAPPGAVHRQAEENERSPHQREEACSLRLTLVGAPDSGIVSNAVFAGGGHRHGGRRRECCTVLPRRRKEMALQLLRSTVKAARGGQQRRSSGSPRAMGVTLGSVQGGGHRSGLMQRRA